MKPKNFPGRKLARQARAKAREAGLPIPGTPPTIADMRFRCGVALRGPDGVGRMITK